MSSVNARSRTVGRVLAPAVVGLAATLWADGAPAQSLTGTTGLVTVPTATMAVDRTLALGVNFLNRVDLPQVIFDEVFGEGVPRTHGLAYFVTVGYLPFLEIGLRVTRFVDVQGREGIGDRMISGRVRLLKEGRHVPAVAVGVNDLVGTRVFHALYGVVSKRVVLPGVLGTMGLHVGYAGDWVSAVHRQIEGPFGGASVTPARFVSVMAEHDGEDPSVGVRLSVPDRLHVLVALQHMEAVSAGISYQIALP